MLTQFLAWAAWTFPRKSSNHLHQGQDEASIPAALSPTLGSGTPHRHRGRHLPTPSLNAEKQSFSRGIPRAKLSPCCQLDHADSPAAPEDRMDSIFVTQITCHPAERAGGLCTAQRHRGWGARAEFGVCHHLPCAFHDPGVQHSLPHLCMQHVNSSSLQARFPALSRVELPSTVSLPYNCPLAY